MFSKGEIHFWYLEVFSHNKCFFICNYCTKITFSYNNKAQNIVSISLFAIIYFYMIQNATVRVTKTIANFTTVRNFPYGSFTSGSLLYEPIPFSS